MTLALWLDLVRTIALVGAAGVAVYGIDAWRRELSGKRKYELAEEVLALFYQARDHIAFLRMPFGSTVEGKSRKPVAGETTEQAKARDQAYVVYERYGVARETFTRVHALAIGSGRFSALSQSARLARLPLW
jgi:hypothetical protein